MALRIVFVHHVAIVPESIPAMLFDRLLIVICHELDFVFHLAPEERCGIGHAPYAKRPHIVKVLRYGHQLARLPELTGLTREIALAMVS